MQIEYLENRPDAIPLIAKWYFDEWSYLSPNKTLDDMQQELNMYLNSDNVPLMLVAIIDDEVVGVTQLKFREMSIYPDKEHWLGGVYVAEKARGKGVGAQLLNRTLEIAKSIGIELLHLQTLRLIGGLYKDLGWEAIEQVNYRNEDVLVMERKLI